MPLPKYFFFPIDCICITYKFQRIVGVGITENLEEKISKLASCETSFKSCARHRPLNQATFSSSLSLETYFCLHTLPPTIRESTKPMFYNGELAIWIWAFYTFCLAIHNEVMVMFKMMEITVDQSLPPDHYSIW
jgi:hypothetical protein